MLGTALMILILYFGLTLSAPRKCVVNDLCLPVNAKVCDNTKCLLVNQSEIEEFTSLGLKQYKFNIGLMTFASSCGYKFNRETSVACDGTVTTDIAFTLTSGPSCNETSTLKYVTEQCDTAGRFTLNKRIISNTTFEECYLYFEPGVALVIRVCLVDPSYPYGPACAAVYVDVHPDVCGDMAKLDEFLEGLGIDFPEIKTECV